MNVNSGGAFYAYNYPSIIKGNMAITGSAGTVYHGANAFNTAYGQSEVWGNFSYTGNSAPLYIGGSGSARQEKLQPQPQHGCAPDPDRRADGRR